MNTTRSSHSVNKALAAMNTNVVKIDSVVSTTNPGLARVVATLPRSLAQSADKAVNALETHFGNKLRVIANSFTVCASNNATVTVSGIMSANVQAIGYVPDMEGFRSVSGNMFLDDAENAWTLKSTATGQVLVRARTQEENDVIEGMMASVSSSHPGTSSWDGLQQVVANDDMRNRITGNDYIVFVNPMTDEVSFGAVACEIVDNDDMQRLHVVVCGSSEEPITIDRRLVLNIVEAHEIDIDDSEIYQESTSSAGHSLDEIVNYYRQVFVRSPAYFDQFIARWKKHAFQ